jgi:hypothetical protein
MTVKIRKLLTVGLILHNNSYTYKDLGLVTEASEEVDAVAGKTKRNYDLKCLKDPNILATTMIETESLYLGFGMLGKPELCDQSLPLLRKELMKYEVKTSYEKRQATWKTGSQKHYRKKKDIIANDRKLISDKLKKLGYSPDEIHFMKDWSIERINMTLRKDGME